MSATTGGDSIRRSIPSVGCFDQVIFSGLQGSDSLISTTKRLAPKFTLVICAQAVVACEQLPNGAQGKEKNW